MMRCANEGTAATAHIMVANSVVTRCHSGLLYVLVLESSQADRLVPSGESKDVGRAQELGWRTF